MHIFKLTTGEASRYLNLDLVFEVQCKPRDPEGHSEAVAWINTLGNRPAVALHGRDAEALIRRLDDMARVDSAALAHDLKDPAVAIDADEFIRLDLPEGYDDGR